MQKVAKKFGNVKKNAYLCKRKILEEYEE